MVSATDASDLTGQPSDRRKLIVVVHADVVGYSRLIGLDDLGTLDRMRRLRREVIDPAIDANGGRIVNTSGDGLLVVFDSVDGAVRSALRVQQQVPVVDGEAPSDRAIRFRIGINMGDVIPDGTDVHGDVVNVAARLQAECSPGGICASRAVRDHMQQRLDITLEALGSLNLRNIAHPVEAFIVRVVATSGTLKSAERSLAHSADALPLLDKPSIAVLSFTNLSADPEQEYFSDGVADGIITELSRSRSLFVIARNSSFTYRGRFVDVKLVARELGVRYVVEGSVRRSGTRVRIAAQLIEAETGNHIWGERYDRALEDVFAVQDEITSAVVTAIIPVVADTERVRALRKPPGNMNAWEVYQRGLWHFTKYTMDDNKEARSLFQKAADIDTRFACAFAGVARTYFVEPVFFGTQSFAQIAPLAVAAARKAVELDPNNPETLATLANALALAGDDISAERYTERALALNPNNADALQQKGAG
jgi:adenylate cyclase